MTRPFLTSYEMFGGAGADAQTASNQALMSSFKVGQSLGSAVKAGIDEKKAAERNDQMGTIAKELFVSAPQDMDVPGAPKANVPAVQVQSTAPASSAPAPAPSTIPAAQTPAMPAAAPVMPSAQPPQPPIAQQPVAAPGQMSAPQQAAPVVLPQVPAPVAMNTTAQPAVSPPTQAQPAPQVSDVDAVRNRILTSPAIGGKTNPYSTEVYEARKAKLTSLVQSGKVKAEYAQEYLGQMDAAREKALSRAVEFEKKVAEIAEKDTTTREKAVAIKAEQRKLEDNNYNDVYQIFKTGDVSGARAAALERGIAFDPTNPQAIKVVEDRAKRSSDYRASAEEARKASAEERAVSKDQREAAKEDRIDWKRDETTALSVGVDPKTGKITYKDDAGNVYSSAEVRAMTTAQKASIARAGRAVVGGGASAPSEPGKISGLKRDSQGNVTLDPGVAKDVGASSAVAESATKALRDIENFEKTDTIKNASSSAPGRMLSSVQSALGIEGERRKADDRFKSFIAQISPLVNGDNPMLKGGVNLFEAKQALAAISDPTSSDAVKAENVARLKSIMQQNINRHDEMVSRFDEETQKYLGARGKGEKTVAPSSSRAGQKGWRLMVDKNGNKAYVGPNGEVEEL